MWCLSTTRKLSSPVARRISTRTLSACSWWIDDQVEWVEKIIWNPLQNMRRDPLLNSLWSHNAKVDLVYRVDYLQQNKLFWSEVTFEFHEIAG